MLQKFQTDVSLRGCYFYRVCQKQGISLRSYGSDCCKNEFPQNKLWTETKEERGGNKMGFLCEKLVGSTGLSYEQSPTENSSTGGM